MRAQRALKLLHFCGTAWFLFAAAYLVVIGLRQAGLQWWLIFSLSGNGASLVFLLVSAYLYALFGSASRSHSRVLEHPLTTSSQYMVLYSLVPFLGAAAGVYVAGEDAAEQQNMISIAMGTVGATFGFWILADPAIGFLESMLPASRRYRLARQCAAKETRDARERQKQQLFADLESQEKNNHEQWLSILSGDAQKLAVLTQNSAADASVEIEAINIGLKAWQNGGLSCMRTLQTMASEADKSNTGCADCISLWWDGIGSWRHKLAG